MKKIIRWLANISGVTFEIEREHLKHMGHRMWQDGYWWNGGLQFHPRPGKFDVWNAFFLYAQEMKRGAYPDVQRIREIVYQFDGKPIEPGSSPVKELTK